LIHGRGQENDNNDGLGSEDEFYYTETNLANHDDVDEKKNKQVCC
jgi:hypothetical protein